MAIKVIERVTCDHCGESHDFEKLCVSGKIARAETTTQWIEQLGWVVIGNSLMPMSDWRQFCPKCKGMAR